MNQITGIKCGMDFSRSHVFCLNIYIYIVFGLCKYTLRMWKRQQLKFFI